MRCGRPALSFVPVADDGQVNVAPPALIEAPGVAPAAASACAE